MSLIAGTRPVRDSRSPGAAVYDPAVLLSSRRDENASLVRRAAGLLGALALIALSASASRAASGGCGMEGCPLETRGPASAASRFSFDLAYQVTDQDQLWNGSGAGSLDGTSAHSVDLSTRTRAWVGAGRMRVTNWLAVSSSLAWFDRSHTQLVQHHVDFYLPYSWNYSGLGDLMVTTSFLPFTAFGGPPIGLAVLAGVKLPTGEAHVTPVSGLEPGPAVRLGTGSTDAMVGLQVSHPLSAPTLKHESGTVPLTLGASYAYAGKGTDDYRTGREYLLSLDTGYPVLQSVRVVGQVSASFHGSDDVGTTAVAPHHSGGTSVLATPGLRVQVSPWLTTYAYYQHRVYQHTNGLEAVAPAHWLVGTSYAIGH